MSDWMLEMVIDGKAERTMLSEVPTSIVLRLYRVDRTEEQTVVAEKVVL